MLSALAFGIIVVGLVVQFGILGLLFTYFGLAGALCITMAVFWLSLVLVEYILY